MTAPLLLGGLFLILLALGVLGARIAREFTPTLLEREMMPLFGWGAALALCLPAGMLTGAGVPLALEFLLLAAIFLLASGIAPIQRLLSPGFLCAFLLMTPFLLELAHFSPREWDDFSHWLPNAHYLYTYGRFPLDSVPSISAWPGYPYGLPLLIAGLSWSMGAFAESAGPLFNAALLMLLSALAARSLGTPEASWKTQIKLTSMMLLVFTILNPGFNYSCLFSSYGDHATAVLLAFLMYCAGQSVLQKGKTREYLAAFGLIAVVFLQIKQVNVYLLLMLSAGLAILAPRNIKTLVLWLLPSLILYGGWEIYKGFNISHAAFHVGAMDTWKYALLPELFAAMGKQALHNWGYTLMLAGLSGWGAVDFFKKKNQNVFAALFAFTTVFYFIFLTLAYLGGSFDVTEVKRAASFARYMEQLQFAGMLAIILRLGAWIVARPNIALPFIKYAGWAAVILVVTAGIAVRLFHLLPATAPDVQAERVFARKLFAALPADTNAGLLAPESSGFDAYVIKYEWMRLAGKARGPHLTDSISRFVPDLSPKALRAFAKKQPILLIPPHSKPAAAAIGAPEQSAWAAFRFNPPTQTWTKLQQ